MGLENRFLAIGALNALREAGVIVPDDISLAGFDDLPESGWPVIDLTTVHYDLSEMATRAAQLLAARIGHPESEPVREEFETRLIRRGSTGPA